MNVRVMAVWCLGSVRTAVAHKGSDPMKVSILCWKERQEGRDGGTRSVDVKEG